MDVSTLSRELQSQLRSDLVVRNVSNCVIELVENSLDANASSIAVRINFDTFHIEVVDNGIGLNEDDLTWIGERYFTSKRKNVSEILKSKHFGHRGEALASIKSVSSKLMIVSRAQNEETTYCKVFEGSTSSIHQSQVERKSVGTTVIIENFLQKLPVRQRCTKPCEEFQTIKWFLQATALIFPKVNFSLRNDNQKSDVFRIDRTNSSASTFMKLYPGAIEDSTSFVKLKITQGDIIVKLMLSKQTCHTDQLQFVFVNKRYLPQCDVHKYLNKLLDRIDPAKKKLSNKTIYILNLACPHEDYDIAFESDRRIIQFKKWAEVKRSLIILVNAIVGDEKSHHVVDSACKKPTKPTIPAKDPFYEINAANTIFGLPANRPKMEAAVQVYDIDSKSNSDRVIAKKKETKISKSRADRQSRLLGLSKASRKVKKNTNRTRSPRLTDQGVSITFTKSPKASRRATDDKYLRDDKNRNPEPRDDYAWMWKQPGKDEDSDSTEFIGTQEMADKSRVVGWKNNKNENDAMKKKNRDERFKSIVTLSSRRVLRLPARERISKKQNYHFDPVENNENVIEKYGKINKKPQYVCETYDKNDAQWTAKISINQSTAIPAPFTLFHKQSSLELDFEDGHSHQTNTSFAEQHDSLVATLPFHEDHLAGRSPLQEIRRGYDSNNHLDKNVAAENPRRALSRYGHIADVEIVDPYCKVNEWISKLPPQKETILNDSANDYITPVNNPQVTDQIANDFQLKTKLSRSLDNDLQSLDRTPEKRKSSQENFGPKCKLKLNFDNAQAEEYEIQMKTCPKPRNDPLLSLELDVKCEKSCQNCDFSNDLEGSLKIPSVQPTQIMSAFEKENYEICGNNMSWKDLNNSYDFPKQDDDLSKLQQTQPISTQSSECPSHCQCKCHSKNFQKKALPSDTMKTCIPAGDLTQPITFVQDDKDDIISIESGNFKTANDSQGIEAGKMKLKNNVSSQHSIENSAEYTKGSEYFQNKTDLIDKLRFKLSSKFLASSSAVDIPKGMLEIIPKTESKIEKLDEDEKKAIGELVKPYKMQDHITLDDFGNSCLRIFPMLKNQPKKSENRDVEVLNRWITFTKEDIPSFEFIAQIENKFILARAIVRSTETPMLILLDQHAVDERIRVERLLRDYTENGKWLSTPINPPIHLSIPPNYSSLFRDYQSNLEEFGLHFEFNNRTNNKETKVVLSFTKVPTCFYNRAMRESNNFQAVLKQLIEALTKEMLKKFISPQGTLVHAVPNELQSIVNYEACRGAVKFGDKLTSQLCSALLNGMVQCKLPFQCAHGRPSVIPLVSFDKLAHFQKKIWKPSLKELRRKLNK